MEVLTGDRELPNNVVLFSDNNLAPFPERPDIISDDLPTKPLQTTEHNFQPPPQKLRPIRCNGRTLPDYSYQTPPPTSGLDGTLLTCYGVRSPDLGFLSQLQTAQKLSGLNGGPDETSGAFAGGIGGFGSNTCSILHTTEVQQIKTELDAERGNLGHFLEAELSSSSDDASGESSEANKEASSRKRKRKTRKTIVLFMEKMMREVMEKQEEMHKQLMETIERRDKERIMREEASKQQEIERTKRDEEVRSQERARSLALISFIENLLGLEIPIPETMIAASPSSMEKDEEGGEIQYQEGGGGGGGDACNKKRWPKSEVQALITVRSALEEKFLKGPKNSVWEEVAIKLTNMGYSRTAKKCKEKWENINKYYKRTMESGKKRPENSKACPYFQELDVLYKSGLIASANPSNDVVKVETEHTSAECQ